MVIIPRWCPGEDFSFLSGLAAATRATSTPVSATLDNGLQILCVENPTTHTVALSAFIKTSARAEATSTAGIRQFVAEAVVDCGAYEDPEISDRINDLGAQVYVSAAIDFTEISVLAAAEDIVPAAELLSEILFATELSAGCIVRQRNETSITLRQGGDLPEIAAERKAAALLYPNHPLGWPVEGLSASVSGFTIEDIERFHKGSYLSNNVLVSVAGGVPARAALAAVESAFDLALPGKALPEVTREPLPAIAGRTVIHRGGQVGVIHVAARAPGPSDPTYAAASVALGVLGSGLGSRMYDSLRREEPIAYTVAAESVAAREGSRAALIVSCPPELVREAESRLMRDVHSLTRELASPEEIQRAKEYICTSYALSHQRSAELAHQLGAFQVAADEGYELDWELPRRVRQTTAEQVRDAAQAMFANPVIVRVMP